MEIINDLMVVDNRVVSWLQHSAAEMVVDCDHIVCDGQAVVYD